MKQKLNVFQKHPILCILLFIGIIGSFLENDTTTSSLNSPSSHKYMAVQFLKESLKDPDSYKEYKIDTLKKSDGRFYVQINYGAKNGFGGMNRKTIIIETKTTDGKYYTRKIIGSSN